jgi:hypothetical protein
MAAKVVFYEYDFKKDSDVAVGSIVWNGKKMIAVGETPKSILDELTEYGIKDYTQRKVKKYFPKDGEKFLSMLKFRYGNPYLRASDVVTI